MFEKITGLHHVTMLSSSAVRSDAFYRESLGLRRVKKTVNRDAPDGYKLFYGNVHGTSGTLVSAVPFANLPRSTPGTGEVSTTVFSVGPGALSRWRDHLASRSVPVIGRDELFGSNRMLFEGPDGETLAFQVTHDERVPHAWGGMDAEYAIRGLHSVSVRVADAKPMNELLALLGFSESERHANVARFTLPTERRNGAHFLDVEEIVGGSACRPGAGSVHRLALAVPDHGAMIEARDALMNEGHTVSDPIDRQYFESVIVRGPENLLLEIATDGSGFATDETEATFGERLSLPPSLEGERERLEAALEPLGS